MFDFASLNATEVAAFVALGGVILSALVAFITSSRTVFVNAITSSRIRWLETFSGKFVEFISLHTIISVDEQHGGANLEQVRALHKTFSEIHLQLNRTSLNEKNIIRLMRLCSETFKDPKTTAMYNELLSNHANWYLKTEWRKIKAEASPLFLGPSNAQAAWKRDREYRRFCEADGRIIEPGLVTTSASPASAGRL